MRPVSRNDGPAISRSGDSESDGVDGGNGAGVTADPTGYKTLVRVLGSPDMPRFEKQWQDWVLSLED